MGFASFTELEGRADNFERFQDEPFFRFDLNIERGAYAVSGAEKTVFMERAISPIFTGLNVDWAARPIARVFGVRESERKLRAYIVHVKTADGWRCWYYKSVIENRALSLLSKYKKLAESEPELSNLWFKGTLAGCDLLTVMRTPEGKPFEVREEFLDREAYVKGLLRGPGGQTVEPGEVYVKEGESYRKIAA